MDTLRAPFLMLVAATRLGSVQAPSPSRSPMLQSGVPFTLDHNRLVVDGSITGPDAAIPIRVWVDTGNPDFWITATLARRLGLVDSTGSTEPAANVSQLRRPLPDLELGGATVSLAGLREALIIADTLGIAPGLPADMNLPSTVLRHYDLAINYPAGRLEIGPPGSVRMVGAPIPVTVNPANGLVQVLGTIAGEPLSLGLDTGASFSFLRGDLVDRWSRDHPAWPRMTGAVGPANLWGMEDEPGWSLIYLASVEVGPARLGGVGVIALPEDLMQGIAARAGSTTAGLLGANACCIRGSASTTPTRQSTSSSVRASASPAWT